jgi:hypothetical protein
MAWCPKFLLRFMLWCLDWFLRLQGIRPDAGAPVPSTTQPVAPSASVAHDVAHAGPLTDRDRQLDKVLVEHIAHSILLSEAWKREHARAEEALRAMGIEIEPPLRQQRKKKAKAPVSKGAKRSARWRAKNPEEYLRRHREEEAARRARKKAEKDAQAAALAAGQAGVSADVVDFQTIRAKRVAEAPQVVVDQVEQVEQRALPD